MCTLVARYSTIINNNDVAMTLARWSKVCDFSISERRLSIVKTPERRFIKCYLSISKWQISIQSTARRSIGLKGLYICLKRGASSAEYCARNARNVTCSGIFRRRDSTMSKWRIFIEIFIDKACEAIYKYRFLYFHTANIHRKHAWHDLTKSDLFISKCCRPKSIFFNYKHFQKPSLLEDFGLFCVCYSSFHDNVCVCSILIGLKSCNNIT